METRTMKLKASAVNSFEFKRERDGSYSYGYSATISVKVGNAVKDVYFSEVTSDYKEEKKGDIKINASNFSALQETGIEIDFSTVIALYKAGLTLAKKEEKDQKIVEAEERWDEYWIHKVQVPEIHKSKITITIEPREKFVARAAESKGGAVPNVGFSCKGFDFALDYTDISTYSHSTNMKYQLYGQITEWKRRNYGKFETAIEKVVELIDNEIKRREFKKQEELRIKKSNEELLNHFQDLFTVDLVWSVISDKEWKRQSYRGARGYEVTRYYLIKGDEKDPDRKIGISRRNMAKHDEKPVYRYDLGSITELTVEQVKNILQII